MLKDKIFLIDDNNDLLFNLKILFEVNNFDTVTATNGKDALKKIYDDNIIPTLIVCDIMMPEMDGYELFKYISGDPRLNSIPFIFLTAKSSSDDVRFGKLLGIDDYLTKPFVEEDLLAIVRGKINKRKKIIKINSHFGIGMPYDKLNQNILSELYSYEDAIVFVVQWDEMEGPKLVKKYSKTNMIKKIHLEKIGVQLFQSSVSIFGFQDDVSSESLLLSIKNIAQKGFLLFDSFVDAEVRGGKRLFMLGLINKEITYYDSLIIEKKFWKYSEIFRNEKSFDLEQLFNSLIMNGRLMT